MRVSQAVNGQGTSLELDDAAAVEASLRGRMAARRLLYDRHAAHVYSTCLRYARDATEAQDMAQDAWLTAFERLETYSARGSFGAWVRSIAVRASLMKLRSQRIEREAVIRGTTSPTSVSPSALSNLSAAELLSHIQSLPPGCRAVFNLVAIEGYSHGEAGELLGISASSSRAQLTRARKALALRVEAQHKNPKSYE